MLSMFGIVIYDGNVVTTLCTVYRHVMTVVITVLRK